MWKHAICPPHHIPQMKLFFPCSLDRNRCSVSHQLHILPFSDWLTLSVKQHPRVFHCQYRPALWGSVQAKSSQSAPKIENPVWSHHSWRKEKKKGSTFILPKTDGVEIGCTGEIIEHDVCPFEKCNCMAWRFPAGKKKKKLHFYYSERLRLFERKKFIISQPYWQFTMVRCLTFSETAQQLVFSPSWHFIH